MGCTVVTTKEVTSSSDIVGNDLRYGPRCSRHTCSRYHSFRHFTSLNDGLACCDGHGFCDMIRAPGRWAQSPVSAQTVPFFRREELLVRCQHR